uniref:Uncharacterized protein n=1 Tax=Peronospora matthiolae TaxID=2874970 RepID=A0AAV1T626_9STRA
MDADVDEINTDDGDDDDVYIFSIANDYDSEDDGVLTGTENVLIAVHTKLTAVDKDELAEELMLTRLAERLSDSFKTLLHMH